MAAEVRQRGEPRVTLVDKTTYWKFGFPTDETVVTVHGGPIGAGGEVIITYPAPFPYGRATTRRVTFVAGETVPHPRDAKFPGGIKVIGK